MGEAESRASFGFPTNTSALVENLEQPVKIVGNLEPGFPKSDDGRQYSAVER